MPWIEWVDEAEAEGRLAEIYGGSRRRGRPFPVSHIKKVHSLHPEALYHMDAFDQLVRRGPSGLTHGQREMIALVVSVLNGCHY